MAGQGKIHAVAKKELKGTAAVKKALAKVTTLLKD